MRIPVQCLLLSVWVLSFFDLQLLLLCFLAYQRFSRDENLIAFLIIHHEHGDSLYNTFGSLFTMIMGSIYTMEGPYFRQLRIYTLNQRYQFTMKWPCWTLAHILQFWKEAPTGSLRLSLPSGSQWYLFSSSLSQFFKYLYKLLHKTSMHYPVR